MRIYLIGNGFDLRYGLATKYENFLHTLSFLLEHQNTTFQSVGQVFGDKELQKQDPTIKASYEKYGDAYNKVILDPQKLFEIINKAQKNMWFAYLRNTMFAGKRWIDFEKEIEQVLGLLERILLGAEQLKDNVVFNHYIKNDRACLHILKCFPFFWRNARVSTDPVPPSYLLINEDYLIEAPAGSRSFVINKGAIARCLFNSLLELAECLKDYLCCFVENVVSCFAEQGIIETDCRLMEENAYKPVVVSLNYTHTWEKLYPNAAVYHIHGEIDDNIVLGINSNAQDTLADLNTVFIRFKKYYQRVIFFSDVEYLKMLRRIKESSPKEEIILHVIGHSLDVTDKDIIQELFALAHQIHIFYYKESTLNDYITNLVSIYGKEAFDRLRYEKKLSFEKTDLLNKE